MQAYISEKAGIDFSKVFEQYLTTARVPELEYKIANGQMSYRWANVVPGFAMPVRAGVGNGTVTWLRPTTTWQTLPNPVSGDSLAVDRNFYVVGKRVKN